MIRNKKILITGNTSGLGFALTEILLAEGNKVFSLSKRPLKKRKNNLDFIVKTLGNLFEKKY